MHRIAAIAAATIAIGFSSLGQAQEGRDEVRAALGPGGEVIRLATRWGRHPRASLQVDKAKPARLTGEAAGDIAVGHGHVIVALAVADKEAPFRVYLLGGDKLGAATKIARPDAREDLPFAVAATATPDGFAVFFQEIEADNPTVAHTYLATVDEDGVLVDLAREVQVPWSLAAAAWNGKGFHLALYYSGDQNGMRLAMVSLTAAGVPEQHPDWSSSPGYIADVHLVADGDKVRAFYRGGAGGDRLLESDVTAIGSWGQEPAKATDHGALASDKAIVISAKGKPQKVAATPAR